MDLISSLMFPIPKASYTLETEGISVLNIGDFKIPVIDLRKKENKHTILYFHGNAEDIGDLLPLARLTLEQGFNFFALEYPGYGHHSGTPSEKSIFGITEIVFLRLIKEKLNLIVIGRSIGTGPASELGSKFSNLIKCVILISPFKSISHVACERASFLGNLVPQAFDNLSKARKITCPYLLIHGQMDKLIHHQHSIDLLKENKSMKKQLLLIKDCDHNNIVNYKTVVKFLKFVTEWLR